MADEKEEKEYEVYNLSELSRGFNLDRATVKKRIEENGIEPVFKKSKETVYALTPQLEELLSKSDSNFGAEKLRKTKAEADIKEIEVAKKRGELVSVADFTDAVQQIFGTMHKKLAVQLPKRLSLRLSKSATQAEITRILTQEISKEFSDLRTNHQNYLK